MAKKNAFLKRIKDLAAKNLSEGEAFLKDNKDKPGVACLSDELQYEVLVEGSGALPKLKSNILCHYQGQLLNGEVFDSSYKRKRPVSMKVNELIKGWQMALVNMPVGSKWKLFIHPRLGYGFEALTQDSGGNCTLVFEIELISIL